MSRNCTCFFRAEIHTSRMTLADDVNLEEFVMTKDEFSGADIKAICTEAGLLALRERRMKESHPEFHFRVPAIVSALEKMELTPKIVAETVTEVGNPKEAICEAVENLNIQLLVLEDAISQGNKAERFTVSHFLQVHYGLLVA